MVMMRMFKKLGDKFFYFILFYFSFFAFIFYFISYFSEYFQHVNLIIEVLYF